MNENYIKTIHSCLASVRLAALLGLHLHPACTWPIEQHTPTHTHSSHCENSFSWPPLPSPFLHLPLPPSPISSFNGLTGVTLCSENVVLTHYVQGVGVVDASVLVLHQTGVVSLVRRHHALHDQGPVLATHLGRRGKGFLLGEANTELHRNKELVRRTVIKKRHEGIWLEEGKTRADSVCWKTILSLITEG